MLMMLAYLACNAHALAFAWAADAQDGRPLGLQRSPTCLAMLACWRLGFKC